MFRIKLLFLWQYLFIWLLYVLITVLYLCVLQEVRGGIGTVRWLIWHDMELEPPSAARTVSLQPRQRLLTSADSPVQIGMVNCTLECINATFTALTVFAPFCHRHLWSLKLNETSLTFIEPIFKRWEKRCKNDKDETALSLRALLNMNYIVENFIFLWYFKRFQIEGMKSWLASCLIVLMTLSPYFWRDDSCISVGFIFNPVNSP